jgi:hypothetical protein
MSPRNRRNIVQERMRVLKNLIDDKKLSPEKLFEIQMEYCYLQREYDLLTQTQR